MPIHDVLPGEILLHVISFLDVQDIRVLRQTCRAISQLTRDKSLWLNILESLRRRGDTPLPPSLCYPAFSSGDVSSMAVESAVFCATRASETWFFPREMMPIIPPMNGDVLAGLQIFLDTWLLVVYLTGHVDLWSIKRDSPRRSAVLDLRVTNPEMRGRWSYCAALMSGDTHIMLTMSNSSSVDTSETFLYTVDLGLGVFEFKHVRSFQCDYTRSVCAIDAEHHLVIFLSSASILGVVCWDNEGEPVSHIYLDDTEETYNNVLAVRFLGFHILTIRTRTIELHSWSRGDAVTSDAGSPMLLKHRLPSSLRQGAVCVSDPIATGPVEDATYSIFILTNDINCLALSIGLPPGGPPTLDVALTGALRPSLPKHIGGAVTPTSYSTNSRRFISTLALGSRAGRALWIERDRTTVARHVRVCTLNHRRDAWHEMDGDGARVVFTLASYDLRDDLTHCALAEVSGRMVLGNRAGAVFLLVPARSPEVNNARER